MVFVEYFDSDAANTQTQLSLWAHVRRVCGRGCGIFVAAQKTNQANALGKCCHTRQTHAGTERLRHTNTYSTHH